MRKYNRIKHIKHASTVKHAQAQWGASDSRVKSRLQQHVNEVRSIANSEVYLKGYGVYTSSTHFDSFTTHSDSFILTLYDLYLDSL